MDGNGSSNTCRWHQSRYSKLFFSLFLPYLFLLVFQLKKAGDDGIHALLSNRSLAYSRCGRFDNALEDADRCISLRPNWSKAHWRRAQALRGLKRKIPAIDSLKTSYDIILKEGESQEKRKEREEVAKETHKVVSSMRREELAEWIVSALQRLQEEDVIQDTKIEDVSDEEKIEACFRHIYSLQKQQDEKRSIYYAKVFEWHLHSNMSVREAYLLRSSIYCRARCLLQAQMDAKLAVASTYKHYEIEEHASGGGADALKKYKELAQAYYQLGMIKQNSTPRCQLK